MRFFAFALGRVLSERVLPVTGRENTVNCPSLQRLVSEDIGRGDIVLARAASISWQSAESIIERKAGIIIFMSGDDERKITAYGSVIYMPQDFSENELRMAITDIASDNAVEKALRNQLAGSSEVMRLTRKKLSMAIASTLPVHIVGETGTGKTLAANLIHGYMGKHSLMVSESCGCLSTGIADSELFGHIKGAFSGASEERKGILEAADGSTLFLDEIQNLSHDLQSKLLRVLDSGEYRKLGSDRVKKTSFRLITASSKTLDELLSERKIRKDFYYRISGIEIRMPSLSEHMEDIPELLKNFERKKGGMSRIIDYAIFMHSFPGNVRELFREAELYLQGFPH